MTDNFGNFVLGTFTIVILITFWQFWLLLLGEMLIFCIGMLILGLTFKAFVWLVYRIFS